METVLSVYNFLFSADGAGVFAGLWLISEALASIPAVQANSVFQLFRSLLKRKAPAPPAA